MSWILLVLAALSGLMLWRDLRSGRIYHTRDEEPLDYEGPERFSEKSESPAFFWVIILTVAVCCLLAVILVIIFFFVPERSLDVSAPRFILFAITIAVLCIYLLNGVLGRAANWIKNYGSVDKKW